MLYLVCTNTLPCRNSKFGPKAPANLCGTYSQATQIESSRMVLGNTIIFGMCTGLIPAAALAAAETQTQLLSISVELVKFSVRINAATKLRTEEIEPLSVPKKSAVVSIKMLEADVKEALEKYHNHTVSHLCHLPDTFNPRFLTLSLLLEYTFI